MKSLFASLLPACTLLLTIAVIFLGVSCSRQSEQAADTPAVTEAPAAQTPVAVEAAPAEATTDFFTPAPDAGAKLPADKVYPAGRIFPVSGYSSPSATLMRDFGFTVAGPVYGSHEKMCKWAQEAKEAGLPILWQLTVKQGEETVTLELMSKANSKKANIDWEAIEQSAKENAKDAIDKFGDSILWWYVTPEELRHWRSMEMNYLRNVADAIRSVDPLKRPISMYQPGHYGKASLEHYTPILDYISQGCYPHAGKTHRTWNRYWAENLIGATKAANRTAIAVTEMYIEPQQEELGMVPAWVKYDVWVPLLYGCRGILVFSLANRKNFESHDRYLLAYSEVIKPLNGERKLGEVLLFGVEEKDLSFQVTDGPDTVTYVKKSPNNNLTFTYPTILFKDIRHATGRYCFAASSSDMPVKTLLKGLPKQPVAVYDAENGKLIGTATDGTFPVEFDTWGVRLLRLEKAK